MATPLLNRKVFDETFANAREATEDQLKLQQQVFLDWARLWPGIGGRQNGWMDTCNRVSQYWSDAVMGIAQVQHDFLNRQFDSAVKSLGSAIAPPATARAQPTQPVAEKAPTGPPASAPQPPALPQRPAVPPPPAMEPHVRAKPQQRIFNNIHQKVAIVTGGASGIGAAVSHELAVRGARTVLLVDLNESVHDLAKSINSEIDREVAIGVVGDTTDEAFRKRVFDDATANYGVPTICVPAAGITRDSLAVQIDKNTGKAKVYPIDDFHKVTEVNLVAPIYWAMEMIGRIAQDRRERGLKRWEPAEQIQGVVVFLGSVSSQGNKGQISYAVAKAGLEGAAATLMKEAIFHGVRCGIIHPGFTDTPMARALGQEFLDKYVLPFTQLRRLIRPDEIADAICFMISNSAVSGELWADAGWHPPA